MFARKVVLAACGGRLQAVSARRVLMLTAGGGTVPQALAGSRRARRQLDRRIRRHRLAAADAAKAAVARRGEAGTDPAEGTKGGRKDGGSAIAAAGRPGVVVSPRRMSPASFVHGAAAVLALAVAAPVVWAQGGEASASGGADGAVEASDEWYESVLRALSILSLILMSGLFSGLTLGLLGLDLNGLEIVMGGNDKNSEDYKNAQTIFPLRERGNLLLCTLLLGNVAVNALLSILSAELTSGTVGFFLSTAVIVLFGEIIPQALCSRNPLTIGAKAVPIVKVIMFFLFPIAYPISRALDRVLGEELGTVYNTKELSKLIALHEDEDILGKGEAEIMRGAMLLGSKKVAEIMTPMESVFTVCLDDKLDFARISEIFKKGFSRIPVRRDSDSDEIVGVLYTKDLILIDPADSMPVRKVIKFFEREGVDIVEDDDQIGSVLERFKKLRAHLALVRGVEYNEDGDNTYKIVGVVTLEDILEEILQSEIVDEFDPEDFATVGAAAGGRDDEDAKRRRRKQFDLATLRLLDESIGHNDLEPDEVRAVAAHLLHSYRVFSDAGFSHEDVEELVVGSRVIELHRPKIRKLGVAGSSRDVRTAPQPSPPRSSGGDADDAGYVYHRDVADTFCTLILAGKLEVVAGREGFASEVGKWAVLGEDALTSPPGSYKPDFSARILSDTVRLLRISHDEFQQMLQYGRSGRIRGRSSSRTRGASAASDRHSVTGAAAAVAITAAAVAATPDDGPASASPPAADGRDAVVEVAADEVGVEVEASGEGEAKEGADS